MCEPPPGRRLLFRLLKGPRIRRNPSPMSRPTFQPGHFYFLVGPTASGKTAIAHALALRHGCEIISTDAMLVYTGMDIGTAKPSARERAEVSYHGLDLVAPDQPFSTGDYIARIRPVCEALRRGPRPVILTGGTGLYVKCIIQGMDELPAADDAIRHKAEEAFASGGIPALQQMARDYNPAALDALADKQNPRRLIRAIEILAQGHPLPSQWRTAPASTPLAGLRIEPRRLHRRIGERVRRMYGAGLLDEAAALRERYPALSRTAAQAIGYREAFDVLDGRMTREQAMEQTIIRTRRLAKRQMTWFRNQAVVKWVDRMPSATPDGIAAHVTEIWSRYGPTTTVV
ncbi:MAG: tRNA (adenosine(37)-N6)-dimethylallyltransferase MiaA [Spartobacteria bacterium]|nr:tRNA (adenosine(37)-N6)-dimethylallyltransferase MiaA [Spartobacteria bacterium]